MSVQIRFYDTDREVWVQEDWGLPGVPSKSDEITKDAINYVVTQTRYIYEHAADSDHDEREDHRDNWEATIEIERIN
jgi:hypothetical protein